MAGRKKSNRFLPYEQARDYIKRYAPNVTSRSQYKKWHKEHNIGFLPSQPQRVYDNFSWNHFLQTTNSFEKTMLERKNMKRKFRPLWEAVRWAQFQAKEYNLTNQKEWERFCDEYEIPDDIPKWPYHAYSDFPGYRVWLGKNVDAKLKAAKENVGVVALHHVVGQPANVIELRAWRDGAASMNQAVVNDDNLGHVIRAFEIDDDTTVEFVMMKLRQHGHERDVGFIVPNINALLWDLIDLKIVPMG